VIINSLLVLIGALLFITRVYICIVDRKVNNSKQQMDRVIGVAMDALATLVVTIIVHNDAV
jgi:hypothetical protein